MINFVIVSTILFGALGFSWTKKDWLNWFVKLSFVCMTGYGIFLILVHNGYVFKV